PPSTRIASSCVVDSDGNARSSESVDGISMSNTSICGVNSVPRYAATHTACFDPVGATGTCTCESASAPDAVFHSSTVYGGAEPPVELFNCSSDHPAGRL